MRLKRLRITGYLFITFITILLMAVSGNADGDPEILA